MCEGFYPVSGPSTLFSQSVRSGASSLAYGIHEGGNCVIGFSAVREQSEQGKQGDEILCKGHGVMHGATTSDGGLRERTSVSGERRTCRGVVRDSLAAFGERSSR